MRQQQVNDKTWFLFSSSLKFAMKEQRSNKTIETGDIYCNNRAAKYFR